MAFTVVEEIEDGNNPQENGGARDSKKGITKELQDVYKDLPPEARAYCNGLRSWVFEIDSSWKKNWRLRGKVACYILLIIIFF